MALDVTDNPATDAAKTVLTKKYGPLPLWAWLIIVTGTVYGVRKFQNSRQASIDAEASDPSTIGSSSLGSGGLVTPVTGSSGSIYGGGSSPNAGSGTGTVPASAPPDTNQAWLNRAIAFLSQRYNAFTVQTALNRFLNGLPVNDPTDRAIVNEALSSSAVGPLPNPINPSTNSTARIVGFVRPAGKWGIFAQYDDGSLIWLKDGISTGRVIDAAKAAGIDTTIQERPVNDPIWQNADVVKSNDLYYLWAERWASLTQPGQYIANRPDIITNADTQQKAQEAWQRTQNFVNANPSPAKYGSRQAWDDAAVAAAFGSRPA